MTATRWTWAAASCRGVSHQRANVRLQDAFTCAVADAPDQPILVIVSDGAGSAACGGEGAWLTCRTIAVLARRYLCANDALPDDETLAGWIDVVRDRISSVAERRQCEPRDFAATLLLVLSNGAETVTLHIGDGCAVVKDVQRSSWLASTWPDHGEYASTTSFVTDEPAVRMRIDRHVGEISAIAAFSDGLERLVLDLARREPFAPFFEQMIEPVVNSSSVGRNRELSESLKRYLDGESVNQRTDDDKTLVLAVRR